MNVRKEIQNIILTAIMLFVAIGVSAIEEKQYPAASWKQKGDVCYNAGRFAEALEYYTKALDGAKRNADDRTYYSTIGNIGNIYAGMNDLKRALYYYGTGYEASVKNHEPDMQWRFSTNIVAAYCMLKDVKSARAFFQQQMKIPVKDASVKRYYFLINQAYISMAENNTQMAEYYFRQTLSFATDRHMAMQYVLSPTIEIGRLRMQKGDVDGALECFRTANDSLQKSDNREQLVSVYRELSGIYKKIGKSDSAAKYRSRYLALSDSIFNVQQFNMANSKLFEYENKQTKERIDSLVSRSNMQLVVIAVFLILVLGLTLLYIALRRRTNALLETQRMLVSKNEELMQNERQGKLLLEQYVKMASRQPAADAPDIPASDNRIDQRSSISLSEEQRNRLLNSITTVMNDVAIISRSDFNLNMLADMVDSNTKYVSWIINDTYKKNFKTMLNEYRIHEACRRMSDTEHYGNMTLQAIYEELGYNSAASFIQSFKKVNGMTPSQYQKLLRG